MLCCGLFGSGGIKWHEYAAFLLFARSLYIFNSFESTRWVGATVNNAIAAALSFACVLFTVIIGTGFFVHVVFGTTFKQFAQLPDALLSLAMFTFGMQNTQLRMTEYLFWEQSRMLMSLMLIYSVVVIAFSLNLLVTIVIDAYYDAKKA